MNYQCTLCFVLHSWSSTLALILIVDPMWPRCCNRFSFQWQCGIHMKIEKGLSIKHCGHFVPLYLVFVYCTFSLRHRQCLQSVESNANAYLITRTWFGSFPWSDGWWIIVYVISSLRNCLDITFPTSITMAPFGIWDHVLEWYTSSQSRWCINWK